MVIKLFSFSKAFFL